MCAGAPVDPVIATREDAHRFLVERIDYERMRTLPQAEEAFKLDRMRELLRRLGDPQEGLSIVHVAGTKGKGSTTAALAAMLRAAGYRTGSFTSPHLDRVEERMAVDGEPCRGEQFAELVGQLRPAVAAMDREAGRNGGGAIGPTYFEITTALALTLFAWRRTDVAILEVGLGGRLDSTNVCRPCVSVVTNISYDHTQQLGSTLALIAREKAGIIKPGVPVVSGVTDLEPREVIRETCRGQGCRLWELGVDFEFEYDPPRDLDRAPAAGRMSFRGPGAAYGDLSLALAGRHQAANAAVALAVLAELREAGWAVPERAVREGLAALRWPARIEVVSRRPAVVIDAAHNVASVEALVQTLSESFSPARRLLIFATTQDKDHRGMLGRLLGHFDEVVFTRYWSNPRAVPPEELAVLARQLTGRSYAVYPQPADAWEAVGRLATEEDLICIAGSVFIAAEMRRQFARPYEV